jgi:hypothetical protein
VNRNELGQLSVKAAREQRLSAEIAEVTGLSRSAVYGRLRRAHGRTLLRNLFTDVWKPKSAKPVPKATPRVPASPPERRGGPAQVHTIARVRQRLDSDCGVAVLAMLARVPYAKAMKVLFPGPVRDYYSGWHGERSVPRALDRLGVSRAPKAIRFQSWSKIPTTSLVEVEVKPGQPGGTRYRHWVIFQRRDNGDWRVIDPQPPRSGTQRLSNHELEAFVGIRFMPVDAVRLVPPSGTTVSRWKP